MHSKLKYYYNLDGLRALAAFGVIIAHFFDAAVLKGHPTLLKIANLGNSGVSLFFVLSGFVITRILIHSVESPSYFKTFYFRRTLRIFPLYYFALGCYYILPFLFLNRPEIPDFSKQLPFWVYLQNFARTFNWNYSGPGHYWSLAVEEHFYLIWPATVYLVFKKNKNALLILSLVLYFFTLVIRYAMLKNGYEIDVFTFSRMDQLVLGSILAVLELRGILTKGYMRIYGFSLITGVILVAYVSTLSSFHLNLFKHNAFGLLYFGLIGFVIVSSNNMVLNRFLTWRPLQYLGKVSYGLYVWHILSIRFHKQYFETGVVLFDFVLVSTITILIASASYYYLEKPFLNLKRFYKYA